MDVKQMLTELKGTKRRLDRAIAALESLQRKSSAARKASKLGKGAPAVELQGRKSIPRKNGTTGLLIPFSSRHSQK